MTDKKASLQAEPVQEVDRIRDIIFGPQMRDYDQRFETVQHDLDRLRQEIDRLSEQLADQDSSQSKKLQALHQEMRQADDDLRNELRKTAQTLMTSKVDCVALGELFIDLGTHLKTGVSLAEVLKGLGEKEQG